MRRGAVWLAVVVSVHAWRASILNGLSGMSLPRIVLFLVGAVLALFSSSCGDSLLWAVGTTEKLGLLTSFSLQDRRVGVFSELFEREIVLVRPESRFAVEYIPFDLFDANRNWKTIAVLGDLSRTGPIDDAVSFLISPETRAEMASKPVAYRIIENVWARGQAVILIHAKRSEDLEQFIADSGDSLLDNYEVALRTAIGPAVLSIGHNGDMEQYVRDHYGFEIGIPKGYSVGEDAEANVVRLYRVLQGEPARFALLHWMPVEEAPQTPEDLLDLRDELANFYYDGDFAHRDRSTASWGSFRGERAMVLSGLWQNKKYVIGGPFHSFGFVSGDRFFFLDGSVYNPPGKKLPYMREVMAVVRTFRDLEAG